LTIKEARLSAGLTQQRMSEIFEIPKRTIENWEAGTRKPPAYVEKLVIRELERISKENNE
jgi:DNA-binding transcriptional regulator YiaG